MYKCIFTQFLLILIISPITSSAKSEDKASLKFNNDGIAASSYLYNKKSHSHKWNQVELVPQRLRQVKYELGRWPESNVHLKGHKHLSTGSILKSFQDNAQLDGAYTSNYYVENTDSKHPPIMMKKMGRNKILLRPRPHESGNKIIVPIHDSMTNNIQNFRMDESDVVRITPRSNKVILSKEHISKCVKDIHDILTRNKHIPSNNLMRNLPTITEMDEGRGRQMKQIAPEETGDYLKLEFKPDQSRAFVQIRTNMPLIKDVKEYDSAGGAMRLQRFKMKHEPIFKDNEDLDDHNPYSSQTKTSNDALPTTNRTTTCASARVNYLGQTKKPYINQVKNVKDLMDLRPGESLSIDLRQPHDFIVNPLNNEQSDNEATTDMLHLFTLDNNFPVNQDQSVIRNGRYFWRDKFKGKHRTYNNRFKHRNSGPSSHARINSECGEYKARHYNTLNNYNSYNNNKQREDLQQSISDIKHVHTPITATRPSISKPSNKFWDIDDQQAETKPYNKYKNNGWDPDLHTHVTESDINRPTSKSIYDLNLSDDHKTIDREQNPVRMPDVDAEDNGEQIGNFYERTQSTKKISTKEPFTGIETSSDDIPEFTATGSFEASTWNFDKKPISSGEEVRIRNRQIESTKTSNETKNNYLGLERRIGKLFGKKRRQRQKRSLGSVYFIDDKIIPSTHFGQRNEQTKEVFKDEEPDDSYYYILRPLKKQRTLDSSIIDKYKSRDPIYGHSIRDDNENIHSFSRTQNSANQELPVEETNAAKQYHQKLVQPLIHRSSNGDESIFPSPSTLATTSRVSDLAITMLPYSTEKNYPKKLLTVITTPVQTISTLSPRENPITDITSCGKTPCPKTPKVNTELPRSSSCATTECPTSSHVEEFVDDVNRDIDKTSDKEAEMTRLNNKIRGLQYQLREAQAETRNAHLEVFQMSIKDKQELIQLLEDMDKVLKSIIASQGYEESAKAKARHFRDKDNFNMLVEALSEAETTMKDMLKTLQNIAESAKDLQQETDIDLEEMKVRLGSLNGELERQQKRMEDMENCSEIDTISCPSKCFKKRKFSFLRWKRRLKELVDNISL